MQETLPHISIAPDRSKQQQDDFKHLRAEVLALYNNGEHVIIVSNRIVQDKRHRTTAHCTSNAESALSDLCKSLCKSPLRVQMLPIM